MMVKGAAVKVRSRSKKVPWKRPTTAATSVAARTCGATLGAMEPRRMRNRRQPEGRSRTIMADPDAVHGGARTLRAAGPSGQRLGDRALPMAVHQFRRA